MSNLIARLGLETARIPHSDRHGLLWLSRGQILVEDGCLRFQTSGYADLAAGIYAIPHQTVSAILLGPGGSITHDALRILARHGTCLMAVGEGGVRLYTAPPLRPDSSEIARRQARVWADPDTRIQIARRMYGWRFSEIMPHADLDTLRGIEGGRVKRLYQILAERYGLEWRKRAYDRSDPEASDDINMAINHAATALYACAGIAVTAVGAIPQLGFIHEDAGDSFCLDIADLYRMSHAIPAAFMAVKDTQQDKTLVLERQVRRRMGKKIKAEGLISAMIDRVKDLFDANDIHRHE